MYLGSVLVVGGFVNYVWCTFQDKCLEKKINRSLCWKNIVSKKGPNANCLDEGNEN